jgi:hypothetical protein
MDATTEGQDFQTAYRMKPPSYRSEFTEVGRGKPMGELLRRYWHPVGLAADASDTPRKVRALGEDLVLFRDRQGRHMTEEHRAYPGDYEAQVGQGPITLHSEEHFGQSDRGVLMVRRMLREQLDLLEAGKEPAGVSFDPNGKPIAFEAGNYIRES